MFSFEDFYIFFIIYKIVYNIDLINILGVLKFNIFIEEIWDNFNNLSAYSILCKILKKLIEIYFNYSFKDEISTKVNKQDMNTSYPDFLKKESNNSNIYRSYYQFHEKNINNNSLFHEFEWKNFNFLKGTYFSKKYVPFKKLNKYNKITMYSKSFLKDKMYLIQEAALLSVTKNKRKLKIKSMRFLKHKNKIKQPLIRENQYKDKPTNTRISIKSEKSTKLFIDQKEKKQTNKTNLKRNKQINRAQYISRMMGNRSKGFLIFFKKRRNKKRNKKARVYSKARVNTSIWRSVHFTHYNYSKKKLNQNKIVFGIPNSYKNKENQAIYTKKLWTMKKKQLLKYKKRINSIYFNLNPFIKRLLFYDPFIKPRKKKLFRRFLKKRKKKRPHFHITKKRKRFRLLFLSEQRIYKKKNRRKRLFRWRFFVKHYIFRDYIKKYIKFLYNIYTYIKFNIKFYISKVWLLREICKINKKSTQNSLNIILRIRLFLLEILNKLYILNIIKYIKLYIYRFLPRKSTKRVLKVTVRLYYKKRNKRIFFVTYYTWLSGFFALPLFLSGRYYYKPVMLFVLVFVWPPIFIMIIGCLLFKISFPFPFIFAYIISLLITYTFLVK